MKLGLGIPVVGSVLAEALGSHMRLAAEVARAYEIAIISPVNMMPHDRARAFVVDSALDLGCDRLLFVDSDTLVPRSGFERLCQTMDETGAKVVSGHYYRRGYPYSCVWSKRIDGKLFQVDAKQGVHEIDTSGLGCALIDLKWVSENIEKPYFSRKDDEENPRLIPKEDRVFFEKVRQAGGKVVGDGEVRCTHLHSPIEINDESVDRLRAAEINAKGDYTFSKR